MDTKIDKLKKVIDKYSDIESNSSFTLAKEFVNLDEKISKIEENTSKNITSLQEKLSDDIFDLKEGLKKKLESELVLEIDKNELKGEQGEKGKDGKDGKDYILTQKDKREIAESVEIPIVEKVIEKQIITKPEIVKEILTDIPAEKIVEKINSLPIEDEYKISVEHIKGLKESLNGKTYLKAPSYLSLLMDVNLTGLNKDDQGRWILGGGGDVNSVNGKTGDVVLVASDIETDNGLGGSNIEEDLLILDERIMTLENTPSFNPTNFTDKTNDYRYFAEVDDVETVVTRYSRTTFIRQTATGLWADRTTLTYS